MHRRANMAFVCWAVLGERRLELADCLFGLLDAQANVFDWVFWFGLVLKRNRSISGKSSLAQCLEKSNQIEMTSPDDYIVRVGPLFGFVLDMQGEHSALKLVYGFDRVFG